MLRGVVSFWLVLGLLIGASLYYFRVNNIAIPYLDEVSVAAPTVVEDFIVPVTVNGVFFNVSIAPITAKTQRYEVYIVERARRFCKQNAEILQLKPPTTIEETTPKDDATTTTTTTTTEEGGKEKESEKTKTGGDDSVEMFQCVSSMSEHLLKEAADEFARINAEPPKASMYHMNLEGLNITDILSKPLMIELKIPVEKGKTYVAKFDATSSTPEDVSTYFCESNSAELGLSTRNELTDCKRGVAEYVITQLKSLDTSALAPLSVPADADAAAAAAAVEESASAPVAPAVAVSEDAAVPVNVDVAVNDAAAAAPVAEVGAKKTASEEPGASESEL